MLGDIDFNKIFDTPFYIVDCSNFVFYPRIVYIKAIKFSSGEQYITCIVNDRYDEHEDYEYELSILKRFKTFKEAEEECKKLNNKPENKKRAEDWNNPRSVYQRNLFLRSRIIK